MRAIRTMMVATALIGVPRAALACPVCFGQSDAPLAIAMNSGILFMLAIVGVMLAAFASFFIYLIRRAKLADRTGSTDVVHGVMTSDPQKGTA